MVKDGVAVVVLEHIVAKVVELDEDTENTESPHFPSSTDDEHKSWWR